MLLTNLEAGGGYKIICCIKEGWRIGIAQKERKGKFLSA